MRLTVSSAFPLSTPLFDIGDYWKTPIIGDELEIRIMGDFVMAGKGRVDESYDDALDEKECQQHSEEFLLHRGTADAGGYSRGE